MPLTTDADIFDLLTVTRRIALVGASANPDRPSNRVMRELLDHGYQVVPVNPGLAGGQLHGQTVVGSLADIDGPVDMVDIFRRSEDVPAVVEQAISIKAGAVWMQLGVVHNDAAAQAEAAGLKVVMDRCPAIEIPRLNVALVRS